MREFLKKELQRLPFTAGINQTKDYSQVQLTELLNELEEECRNERVLSVEKKKELIENGILNDSEFYGLNRKIINKWFYQHKVANQVAGKQQKDSPEYLATKAKNDDYYKKMVADRKKEDPSYNPAKEAMDYLLNLTKIKTQAPTKKRRRGGSYVDFEEVK